MKRMASIVAGCLIFAAAVAVVVLSNRKAAPKHVTDPRPICLPEDVWLRPGWPSWTVCSDSNGYYTCWRALGHTGRHCAWDLDTGRVVAVWPCTQLRAITRARHQEEP